MSSTQLELQFRGSLSTRSIDLIADLLLSGQDCELCGQRPAEHFTRTPYGDRHCCTQCYESLPEQEHEA